jgi:hypothetical protein
MVMTLFHFSDSGNINLYRVYSINIKQKTDLGDKLPYPLALRALPLCRGRKSDLKDEYYRPFRGDVAKRLRGFKCVYKNLSRYDWSSELQLFFQMFISGTAYRKFIA